jgi:hypothetical protein
MVEVMGFAVAFVPVKAGVFPVPLAASPMAALELVHAKVVPATGLEYADAAMGEPAQTVVFAIAATDGVGLTVMV